MFEGFSLLDLEVFQTWKSKRGLWVAPGPQPCARRRIVAAAVAAGGPPQPPRRALRAAGTVLRGGRGAGAAGSL